MSCHSAFMVNEFEQLQIFVIWQKDISGLFGWLTLNPFPNKPWFLRVCSSRLLKTLWEKEKLLGTNNFSFSHSVWYLFEELSAVFIRLKLLSANSLSFGKVLNLLFGKGLYLEQTVGYLPTLIAFSDDGMNHCSNICIYARNRSEQCGKSKKGKFFSTNIFFLTYNVL